jgi:hypothetical protein
MKGRTQRITPVRMQGIRPMSNSSISADLLIWIEARQRFRLSHAQIQMARELGWNPKHFGKLANHKQEPWKLPLPEFIEECYQKRFKKERPEIVRTIEDIAKVQQAKKRAKKEQKQIRKEPLVTDSTPEREIPNLDPSELEILTKILY